MPSLCNLQEAEKVYLQLPAFIGGVIALVINPTITLIHDQAHHLCSKGISVTFLCSTQRDPTTASSIAADKNKVI